jgi:general secretion pathway protein G
MSTAKAAPQRWTVRSIQIGENYFWEKFVFRRIFPDFTERHEGVTRAFSAAEITNPKFRQWPIGDRFALLGTRPKPIAGFTLIELMMVLTVISILVSIAIPIANSAIIRSKEAVLRSNLYTLRTLIDQYTADKLKAPQSLDDLVSAGYLRSVPKDPITDSNTTWEVVMEDAMLFPEQTETGIFDVHSGSTAVSSDGTPYNEW